MPFSGVGTWLRNYSWATDKANGILVRADRSDTELNDIAAGLSNCMTRDGQSPPTAAIPMGGQKLTGLANGSAPQDGTTVLQVFTSPTFTSPTFTGTAATPTAALGDSTTKPASTAFAMTMQSPTFSGTPAVPTAAAGTSTTQIASTAYAMTMQSPAFTGTPRAPTAAPGASGTQLATLDYANALALSAALPAQASAVNAHMRSKGTGTAAWTEDSFTTLTTAGTLIAWHPYRFDTATQTYLLPATPVDGDEVLLANIGTNVDNILSGNGHNIVGPYSSDATVTMDVAYAIYRVKYDSVSTVWRAF